MKEKFGKDKKLFPLVNFSILENRIFLIINNESDNIYEIANFEYSKNLFNVEFIIEFISHKFNDINSFNNHLLEYFNNKGIQNLVSCGNPIKTNNNNIIFNLYPINNSKNITINKAQEHAQNKEMVYSKKESFKNIENNQFCQTSVGKESNPLKNVFNFNNPIYNNHQNNLRKSFNTTTSRMINQMRDSLASSANKKRYYLIDIRLHEYLIHLYQNPDVHLNITQINYTKNILYENKVINSDDKNNYLINFEFIYIQEKKFSFPNNFEIIDSDFLTQIKNRFGSEIPDKFIIQIRLINIKGGIILIPKNKNVMNDEGNLIYLYSIQENEQKNKFKIKIIIDCRSVSFGERINIFRSIIQIPNYENIIQNPKILENHNNLKYYIIPDNKYINEITKNNEQNMDYYLMLLIIINRERNNLSTFIKQSHKNKTTEISECYLINKNYISVLNMFLPVLYINDIMNKNIEKNDADILNIIKSNLE